MKGATGWLVGLLVAVLSVSAAAVRADEKEQRPHSPPAHTGQKASVEKTYWIGVALAPVRPELRAQLDLPDGVGLVIVDVVEDSPADKAGLKEYDVVVRAGGKDVTDPQVLVDAVQKARDSELTLEVVRKGRRRTVKVKPVERPEVEVGGPEAEWPEEWVELHDLSSPERFRKLWQELRRGRPLRFRLFGQPYVFEWEQSVSLPKNLTITITKEGDQPARIVVRRNGKRWEVTEDELEKLPPDVRRHVQRLLGRGFGAQVFMWDDGQWELDVDTFRGPNRGGAFRMLLKRIERLEREKKETTERMEKKLGEAVEEIDALQKQLKQLQEQLQKEKAGTKGQP